MTAQAFFESHRDAGKMPGESAHAVDGAAVFVETLFSMMLALPRPRHPPLYYGTLLFDLSELLETAPRLLERALHRLVARLPDLDAELQLRLAEWLAVAGQRVAFSVRREAALAARGACGLL